VNDSSLESSQSELSFEPSFAQIRAGMAVWQPECVEAKTPSQNLGFYDLMQHRRSCTESRKRQLIGKLSIRAFF
jgi:hypothetical protein